MVYLNPGSEQLEEYKKKKAVLEEGRRDSKICRAGQDQGWPAH
ncbi:hypothetical protein MTY_2779 [Moorella thermoacetica Y72]|uniref:Uncharacterized protein n=1 Tax=Moorella thermoacetica Y72 TaxID=1325331 RepID=A0A061M242_NEOTH|nr:hypothetical protein MTY_2779 [Moorella thermoacetica Y72]